MYRLLNCTDIFGEGWRKMQLAAAGKITEFVSGRAGAADFISNTGCG
jgi:hypothetical protein